MDEIDAIDGRRFSEGTSVDRKIQRTLMELLNQVDDCWNIIRIEGRCPRLGSSSNGVCVSGGQDLPVCSNQDETPKRPLLPSLTFLRVDTLTKLGDANQKRISDELGSAGLKRIINEHN
jgi:hypothetical protein